MLENDFRVCVLAYQINYNGNSSILQTMDIECLNVEAC